MSSLLSTIFLGFAATAAAADSITTSLIFPGGYDAQNVGFYGSVVGASNGATTLALVFDNDTATDYYDGDNLPATYTFGGSTSWEYATTTTDSFEGGDMTVSARCTMTSGNRARPTCTASENGAWAVSDYCYYYTESTYSESPETWVESFTSDAFGPATAITYTDSESEYNYVPSYCTNGASRLPDQLALSTVTLERSDVSTYSLLITAGQNKLSAATGAAASATGASATGSTLTGSVKPTGTAAGASGLPDHTGAAAPAVTAMPVLAGLGAAVAAFVL